MIVCPYCGAQNTDGSSFCSECGAPLKSASEAAASAQAFDDSASAGFEPNAGAFGAKPAADGFEAGSSMDFGGQAESLTQSNYTSTYDQQPGNQQSYQQQTYQPGGNQQQPYQQANWNAAPMPVAPVSTGGLLAWSIVTLLLCTIPGIVALVYTLGINKATTVEEQQKKMSTARMWCIIGTALGVLSILFTLISRS